MRKLLLAPVALVCVWLVVDWLSDLAKVHPFAVGALVLFLAFLVLMFVIKKVISLLRPYFRKDSPRT